MRDNIIVLIQYQLSWTESN